MSQDDVHEDEPGICMNCGAPMDENPTYPWCPDCEAEDEA